jgi:hypothetical protein
MTLLGESVVLASLGSAGGILLAFWLLDAVRVHLPFGLPRIDEVAVDLPTLLFALAVTLLCAVLCGLAPAWRLSGADPADALKDGGHGSTISRGVGRLRAGLISCEVGMCVVLLVGAGLLLTSFFHIAAIDQGFKPGNVFVAEANLSGPRYKDPQVRIAFFREAPQAEYRTATPGYIATMNIPILRGRVFDDRAEGPKVALISQRTTQRIWPAQDPIGWRLKDTVPANWRGSAPGTVTVVGVVGDVRSTAPNSDPPLMVYLPSAQNPPTTMTFVLRTAGTEPPIRQVVKDVDPLISFSKIGKVDEIVSG